MILRSMQPVANLGFKFRPDHEDHLDNNKDGIYEVMVQAQEVSDDNYTDQRLFLIEVVDGSELPVLSPNFSPTFLLNEDTNKTFYLEDFRAIDSNNPGGKITAFKVTNPPRFGKAVFFIEGNSTVLSEVNLLDLGMDESNISMFELKYIPDANYSGLDEFTVEAFNDAGLPATLQWRLLSNPYLICPLH